MCNPNQLSGGSPLAGPSEPACLMLIRTGQFSAVCLSSSDGHRFLSLDLQSRARQLSQTIGGSILLRSGHQIRAGPSGAFQAPVLWTGAHLRQAFHGGGLIRSYRFSVKCKLKRQQTTGPNGEKNRQTEEVLFSSGNRRDRCQRVSLCCALVSSSIDFVSHSYSFPD